jgi:hypothetical protein
VSEIFSIWLFYRPFVRISDFEIGSNPFAKKEHVPWPLWFDRYSFGTRCYNTLKCSTVFSRRDHSLHQTEPSWQPYASDWKDRWEASFNDATDFERYGFPTPVDIRWIALDGVERRTSIDLEEVFPNHLILEPISKS